MKKELLFITLLTGLSFSTQAKTSCKILMNSFEAEGIETEFDLADKPKLEAAYQKCIKDMRLLPNSYTSFQDRTQKEADKRDVEYRRKERSKKKKAQDALEAQQEKERLAKIRATRELYTFSKEELQDMFFKPVFAYRLESRERYTDDLGESHYKLSKLTDVDKLCQIIGKEHEIKGMRGLDAKIDLDKSRKERDDLNNAGVYMPDWKLFSASTWDGFELYETSREKRRELRKEGSRKLDILEFSEVTCVFNENKKDDFEDIEVEVLLKNKKGQELSKSPSEDEIILKKDEVNGMDETISPDRATNDQRRTRNEADTPSADDILNYTMDEQLFIDSLTR